MNVLARALTVVGIVLISAWIGAQYAYNQAVEGINQNYTFFTGNVSRASWRAQLVWPIGFEVNTYVWSINEPLLERDRASQVKVERWKPFFVSSQTKGEYPQ